MWKLLASISFCILVFQAIGQDTSHVSNAKEPIFILGINTNPFTLKKSYSASTTYSVEAGFSSSPLFIKLAFGLPHYQEGVITPHKANYQIKGYYIESGFTFYLGNPIEKSTTFFVSATGYFASFKHQLTLDVEDANWGTKQRFNDETRTSITGLRTQFGIMSSFSPKFKFTSAVGFGFYFNRNTPFNDIYGFEKVTDFTPGMGYGSRIPLAVNIGLCYIVD